MGSTVISKLVVSERTVLISHLSLQPIETWATNDCSSLLLQVYEIEIMGVLRFYLCLFAVAPIVPAVYSGPVSPRRTIECEFTEVTYFFSTQLNHLVIFSQLLQLATIKGSRPLFCPQNLALVVEHVLLSICPWPVICWSRLIYTASWLLQSFAKFILSEPCNWGHTHLKYTLFAGGSTWLRICVRPDSLFSCVMCEVKGGPGWPVVVLKAGLVGLLQP